MSHHAFKSYRLFAVLLLGLCLNTAAFSSPCYPKVDQKRPQYLIGYGSLIDEESKKRTDSTVRHNIPVVVKGYERYWGVHGNAPGLNATFLSVREQKKAFFNGVMYQLKQPSHIEKYDQREKVYCRKELSLAQIQILDTPPSKEAQIWIYVPHQDLKQSPTADFPVVQSYIDVFMRGCIQIGEKYQLPDFAKQCVLTTQGWPDKHWVNDRIFPRRPLIHEPYAHHIDRLLKETLPEKFKNIISLEILHESHAVVR